MNQNDKVITVFSTRVRQMILRFQELKKENEELYAMVEQSEKEIQSLNSQISKINYEYEVLKTAKMMEITDGDLQGAKDRVAKLIRDVNKCIAILSDEQ